MVSMSFWSFLGILDGFRGLWWIVWPLTEKLYGLKNFSVDLLSFLRGLKIVLVDYWSFLGIFNGVNRFLVDYWSFLSIFNGVKRFLVDF